MSPHATALLLAAATLAILRGADCDRGAASYMGCFEDAKDRLLDGAREDSDVLSPESCVDFCYRRRFQLAGLEYGKECFCGDSLKGKSRVADTDCNMQCGGDPTRLCGGAWRLAVYNTGLRLDDMKKLNAKYIGCYIDPSVKSRLMRGYKKVFRGVLTNSLCQQYCHDLGFHFAGTEWRNECFCSNKRPTFKFRTAEDECSETCEGNNLEKCGGALRLSVYDISGVPQEPISDNYEGCFSDFNEFLDVSKGASDVMTPEYCLALCYRDGYRFSGTHSGNTCHCGNSLSMGKYSGTGCQAKCKGDSAFSCGGNSVASVYSTGIPANSSQPYNVLYEGCYEDSEERMMIGSSIPTSLLTKEFCVEYCFRKAFRYAGLEYGYECYCDDQLGRHGEVTDVQCKTPCSGNTSQRCGASWRLSVYSTGLTDRSVETSVVQTPRPSSPRPMLPDAAAPQAPAAPPPQAQAPPPQAQAPPPQAQAPAPRPRPRPDEPMCEVSKTELFSAHPCRGFILFEDDFRSERVDDKRWTHSVYMPQEPDFPFVVFQENSENVYTRDGILYIKPTVMTDELVRKGSILLQNCTGKVDTEECTKMAEVHNILPPIKSARIHTKDNMSFRYGKVEIRAKLPLGDWIVPEIWLEPKDSEYGENYASGRIRIAMARGNRRLNDENWDMGNKLLEAGVLLGVEQNIQGRTVEWNMDEEYHDKFHVFTLRWTPDNIGFSVDGGKEFKLLNTEKTLRDLVGFNEEISKIWNNGTAIAPFDQEFYVSLGVSVGGVRDFPDDITSGDYKKPWRNMEVKAMANFWLAHDKWNPTWVGEDSALQVDYVKVTAL